jgi:hypothetical protein
LYREFIVVTTIKNPIKELLNSELTDYCSVTYPTRDSMILLDVLVASISALPV